MQSGRPGWLRIRQQNAKVLRFDFSRPKLPTEQRRVRQVIVSFDKFRYVLNGLRIDPIIVLTRYKITLGSERLRQRFILEGRPTRASLTLLPVYGWFIKGLESLPSNEVSIRPLGVELTRSPRGRGWPLLARSG